MSKETEPIRSRRQLREQLAQSAGVVGNPPAPVRPAATKPAAGSSDTQKPRSTPAGPPPAAPTSTAKQTSRDAVKAVPNPEVGPDSKAAPKERQSQTRARDRAALRAYKELLDQPNAAPLPSRRALRQAQLDADRAPVTAVNPVVSSPNPVMVPPARQPAAGHPASGRPAAGQPVATGEAAELSSNTVASDAARADPGARTRVGRRAANTGPDLTSEAAAADATYVPGQSAPLSAAEADVAQAEALAAIKKAAVAAAGRVNRAPEGKIPAAAEANYAPLPGLIPGGSYYPVSAGPPAAAATPSPEELRVLTTERAEAERAAILAERAQARDRLAQESAKSRRPASDPTATHNLAMVTPLEFIEVEGVERPVLRPPSTTHVPIITRSTPRQSPAKRIPPRPEPKPQSSAVTNAEPAVTGEGVSEESRSMPSMRAERFDAALSAQDGHRPGPGNRPLTSGRSSTLKRAQAMATDGHPPEDAAVEHAGVTRSQMPPVPADYAHGLEPLDAVTAGLGRTQRNMLLQWGSMIVGGAALVAIIIMLLVGP